MYDENINQNLLVAYPSERTSNIYSLQIIWKYSRVALLKVAAGPARYLHIRANMVQVNGNSSHETTNNGEQTSKDDENQIILDDRHSEVFLQMVLNTIKTLWSHIKDTSSYIMIELGGYNALDKIAQFLARNPYAIYILIIFIIMSLPFLILVAFGLVTIVMTFTGFLVIEGTLISIVSMLLFGCLGALAIVLIFFAVITVAAYFGFVHIYDLFGGEGSANNAKTALINYINKERRKFFTNPNTTNPHGANQRTNLNNNIRTDNGNIETISN